MCITWVANVELAASEDGVKTAPPIFIRTKKTTKTPGL